MMACRFVSDSEPHIPISSRVRPQPSQSPVAASRMQSFVQGLEALGATGWVMAVPCPQAWVAIKRQSAVVNPGS